MSLTDQQLLKQLPENFGYKPLYRLRWRFLFSDGKPDRVGVWNGTSQSPQDMASFVNKNNLLYAIIEGEKVGSWTTKEIVKIEGHKYATCKWHVALSTPVFIQGNNEYVKAGDIVGLQMQTNDNAVTVFVDGTVKKEKLTDEERKFKLHEHRGI